MLKMNPELKIGDCVVVMSYSVVPLKFEASSYVGTVGIITKILDENIVEFASPNKLVYGKPPVDRAPICQLVKISEEEGFRYINSVHNRDTYDIVKNRCK